MLLIYLLVDVQNCDDVSKRGCFTTMSPMMSPIKNRKNSRFYRHNSICGKKSVLVPKSGHVTRSVTIDVTRDVTRNSRNTLDNDINKIILAIESNNRNTKEELS